MSASKLIDSAVAKFILGQTEGAMRDIAETVFPQKERDHRHDRKIRLKMAAIREARSTESFDVKSALETFAMDVADIKHDRQPAAIL